MSRDGSDAAGAVGPSRATVNKRGGKPDTAPREASRTPAAIFVAVLIGAAAIFAAYMIQNMEDTGNVRGPGKYAAAIPALRAVAAQLLHPEKGILAADESPTTFGARLAGHPNKPTLRQAWRRILLTTPGLATHISGVILHEETFAQAADLQAARAAGVLLGIKLDNGTAPMGPKQAGELHTRGLGGLAGRCATFHTKHGASFAKWRAVFRAGAHTPSKAAIRRNSKDLASYAAAAQKCGLVPIIEPEVLADGDHDLSRAANASARVLRGVFRALRKRGDVDVGAVLLKAAMVTPGSSSVVAATPEQVANTTLRVLLGTVPRALPGVVFLSGGQSEELATTHMAALGRLAAERRAAGKPLPWALSFSFGRALQASAMKQWLAGDVPAAQQALLRRAAANALAQQGLAPEATAAAAAVEPADAQ